MWPRDDGVNLCVLVAALVFVAEAVVVAAWECWADRTRPRG
jgi:hypothetical protein